MKMKRRNMRIISLLIALALLVGMPAASFGEVPGSYDGKWVGRAIEETGTWLMKEIGTPTFGTVGGDWSVIGLARSEMKLPEGFTDGYYKNIEAVLQENKGELTRNKYSEYSRLILALSAIGKDPKAMAGYNLVEKLSDLELIKKQGINGPIYALLALDSLDYQIPQSASAAVPATRELLLSAILERELPGGGFSLSTAADPDVTAAALQALSNYSNRSEVKAAIDRALGFLSSVQTERGGFTGWAADGEENAESIAQVILALTSLGIDPAKDGRFIKTDRSGEKYSPLDALAVFQMQDGSYRHLFGGNSDLMATEQAMLALVSYQRLLSKQNSLFNMKDVSGPVAPEGAEYEYKVMFNGQYMVFDQVPVNRGGRVLVPMRAIFETLGADVEWDPQLQKATGIMEDRRIELTIGDNTAYVNDTAVLLDVPAVILNGRTLLPVRFISENLDAEVKWEASTKTVVITKE